MNTDSYYAYLQQLRYSQQTITQHLYLISALKDWCRLKRTCVTTMSYKQLLNYVQELKNGNNPKSINVHLWAIRIYFGYLVLEGDRYDNIAEGLHIRGQRKKVLHNLLNSDELEDLYYSYQTNTVWKDNFYYKATAKRNKVIIGLLVYQGLISTNLMALEVEHLQLNKGTIYIPGSRKNVPRTLPLQPPQIIALQEYMQGVRPILQEHIGCYDEKLIPTHNPQFNTILKPILKQLKTYNQKVSNNTHIRASVIVNWLKHYNLRKVQQMAGHKYISSTEAYRQDNLENLHQAIDQFHPLG